MSYLALYRKYRPRVFDDVIGQDHIVRTLQNQIKAERISHAYLFTGSRGTGKTTIAKIFARAVNCEQVVNGSACGTCATCKRIENGASMNSIEIDAASHNGVDNIREINEEVKYSPTVGTYKVYIIDEVHMLSTGAFNALLKTLEEPPAHVIFILATTDPQKIPVTILSRCQRFDFKRISAKAIEEKLETYMEKEDVDIESEALAYIARLADGGMRDALSILEQCISFYFTETITLEKVLYLVGAVDTKFLFDMLEAIRTYDTKRAIEICDEVNEQGRSIRQFNNDLLLHVRNLLIAKTTNGSVGVLDYSKEYIGTLLKQAESLGVETLMRYIRVFSELDNELKIASNQRVLLEVAVLKLCEVAMDLNSDSMADKINALEAKLNKALAEGIQITSQVNEIKPAIEKEVKPTRLPEAVPEEVRTLPSKWPEILKKLGVAARLGLGSVTPGVIEGDIFYIVHAKGMEPVINEHIEAIKAAIGEVVGKEVRIVPMRDKIYNAKTTEVYGTNPEKSEVTDSIGATLRDIQSKVNYNITEED